MTNKEIAQLLEQFDRTCCGDNYEETDYKVEKTTKLKDEATLVEFTFGEGWHRTAAVVYEAGEIFTLNDWQNDVEIEYDDIYGWIEQQDWITIEGTRVKEAIVFQGLPRILF